MIQLLATKKLITMTMKEESLVMIPNALSEERIWIDTDYACLESAQKDHPNATYRKIKLL